MYKASFLLAMLLAVQVFGKRHGHAIVSTGFKESVVKSTGRTRLSDSTILEGLAHDTDKERSLLRRTSKTFVSLNNKLKSILREA